MFLQKKSGKLILCIFFFYCANLSAEGATVEQLPFYNSSSFTPVWMNKDDVKLKTMHKISKFKLKNQVGSTVTQESFKDKIFIANFFFAKCPGICPKVISNLSTLQKEFINDKEVLLVSHSVNPTNDTVDVLKNYAKKNNVNSKKWYLLTGDKKQLYDLGRNSYFVDEDMGLEIDEEKFLHTENVILVDQNMHIRGIYNALNRTSLLKLKEDVEVLKR